MSETGRGRAARLNLPREFQLVLACCRWPPSEARDQAVLELAPGLDWTLVERLARRHRIEALVWAALKAAGVDVPDASAQALGRHAAGVAAQNLMMLAESLRLRDRFAASQVPLLFVKGLTLAQLAYGTPSLKAGWDIDILVEPARVEEGGAVLAELGYERIIPEPSGRRDELARWHRHMKESVWRHPAKGVHVELHTALVNSPLLLAGLDPFRATGPVELRPGAALTTLGRDELFAYLCVHGASSAWFRLKWLADLAALIAGNSRDELQRLYEESQALGAGRAADQALLLCNLLLDVELGPEFRNQLKSRPVSRWLVRQALKALAGKGIDRELDEIRLGTLPIHLSQYALLPGWRYKADEAHRQLLAEESPLRRLFRRA